MTDTLSFEEDGFLRVHGAIAEGRDLLVYLEVSDSGKSTSLCVRAHEVRAHHVVAPGGSAVVSLTDDHPILWPHTQLRSELYFRGKVDDVMSVVGALVVAHHELVGSVHRESSWLSHNERVMNPTLMAQVLEAGDGLLSTGPVKVLEAYSRVLDAYGISYSILEPTQPSWWTGEEWKIETEKLFAILIGESYVIAPRFTEELEPSGLKKLVDWFSAGSNRRQR
jgi:hypothetical protein